MKKVFIMVGVLFLGMSAARAQKQTGFAMSTDLLLGYKDKNFTTTIGYESRFVACTLAPDRW